MNKEMLKGSIDLLLLSIISKQDMYGYEIIQALKESSEDHYEMSEGTLYPALKRLESQDFISSYWTESENKRRRKYYQLTEGGRKALADKLQSWHQLNKLILKWGEGSV